VGGDEDRVLRRGASALRESVELEDRRDLAVERGLPVSALVAAIAVERSDLFRIVAPNSLFPARTPLMVLGTTSFSRTARTRSLRSPAPAPGSFCLQGEANWPSGIEFTTLQRSERRNAGWYANCSGTVRDVERRGRT